MLLSNMPILDSLLEDSCLSVNIDFVVVDAETEDEVLTFVVANCVELVALVAPV